MSDLIHELKNEAKDKVEAKLADKPEDCIEWKAAELIKELQGKIKVLETHIARIHNVLNNEGKTVSFEYSDDQFQIDDEILNALISEAPELSLVNHNKQVISDFVSKLLISGEVKKPDDINSLNIKEIIAFSEQYINKI